MQKCIELAKIARQRGESPVGAVVVRLEAIIGEGIESSKTHQDITYHAEMEAIRAAIKKVNTQNLSDCILYTTHDPCIMCSYLIRHTKIPLVVMGILTGEMGGYSSQLPVLLDTAIKKWQSPPVLLNGILEDECRKV